VAARPRFAKAPPELVALLAAVLPKDARVERRKMFGYDCGFANGHLFAGLFQSDLMVRLPEPDRAALLALSGARPFEPMPGRPMREYAVVPRSLHEDRGTLAKWVAKGFAYATSLPPKGKPAKASAAKKAKSRS
jgi:hypothetical protein